MADPFSLTTADPRFDPSEPVTINGYLYAPVNGVRPAHKRPALSPGRREKTLVEVQRRRVVEHG